MNSSDDFARELFEDAKHTLLRARQSGNQLERQRYLRHSLTAAFSFLELQIDLIAQHFKKNNSIFSLHEQGMLLQMEVAFDRGAFRLKDRPKFARLQDRMLLLQRKFAGSKLTERAWWQPLIMATDRRNSIAHPRGPISLDLSVTDSDLQAVLGCANDLFAIVFAKGLPYASLGTKPKI